MPKHLGAFMRCVLRYEEHFFGKYIDCWKKYCRAIQAIDGSMEHWHCTLDT